MISARASRSMVVVVVLVLASLVLGAAPGHEARLHPHPHRRPFAGDPHGSQSPHNPHNPLTQRQAVCAAPGFTPGELYLVSGTMMAAGDFRGNGIQDLAVIDGSTGLTVTLYANDGTGSFTQAATYTSTVAITGIAKGNFIGSASDQIVINLSGNFALLTVAADGSISAQTDQAFFGTRQTLAFGNQAYKFVVADVNRDGLDDIYATIETFSTTPSPLGPVLSFVSTSNGGTSGNVSFAQPRAVGALQQGTDADTPFVGDLNGDGFLDSIIQYTGSRTGFHLFDNINNGGVESVITNELMLPYAAIGRLSNSAAYLAISSAGNQVEIYAGGRQFAGFLTYPPPVTTSDLIGQIIAADFNRDGFDDLVVMTNYGPIFFLNLEGLTFAPGQLYPMTYLAGYATALQGLVVADFNGDGNPDFAVVRHQGPIIGLQIFLNNCAPYSPPTITTSSTSSTSSTGAPTSTVTVTLPVVTITAPGTTVTATSTVLGTTETDVTTVACPATTETDTTTIIAPGTTITATATAPGTTETDITTAAGQGTTETDTTTAVLPAITITGSGTTVTILGTTVTVTLPGTTVTSQGTTFPIPATTITRTQVTITVPTTIEPPTVTTTVQGRVSTRTITIVSTHTPTTITKVLTTITITKSLTTTTVTKILTTTTCTKTVTTINVTKTLTIASGTKTVTRG